MPMAGGTASLTGSLGFLLGYSLVAQDCLELFA